MSIHNDHGAQLLGLLSNRGQISKLTLSKLSFAIFLPTTLYFSSLVGKEDNIKRPCPPKDGQNAVDIIFTDYYGLLYLRKKSGPVLQHNK